ncbi:hypothetical protein ACSVIJ_04355 [Pseudomonas sp. NCHU5208]|uniref:hypothetical protein n=1 Tax=unclassified Pseudomonas TaxID=196821 RepID=UPI003F967805
MYAVMVLTLALAIKGTVYLSDMRVLPADYDQIDRTLTDLRRDVEQINKLEVLPKLEASWRTASAIATLSGVSFTPFDAAPDAEPERSYSGPLRHWNAQLEGEPRIVLSIARAIQTRVPTFLYDYAISGGVMKLNITVVGT